MSICSLPVVADPRLLITTKKQIKTTEDIKGMKLRILGGPPTDQMKALGAVPLLMPMPDSYQALDKGVIDGMDISWEGILSFRLYEVVKYYTFAPLTTSYHTIVMNKQKWDSCRKTFRRPSAASAASRDRGPGEGTGMTPLLMQPPSRSRRKIVP